MVRVVVAARTNRVSPSLPVIVSDGLNGYSLSGDGRRPPCHQTLLVDLLVIRRMFASDGTNKQTKRKNQKRGERQCETHERRK